MISSERPFKPEIPFLVPPCEIAGANPIATMELLRRRLVVPVPQPIAAAVVDPLSDQPDRFRRQLLARLADDRHALSGRRKPHRAGLHLHCKAIVVADRQSELCGSEMIHRNDAPGTSKEIHDFRVQRLAATRYRTNRRSEPSYRFAARHQTPQHRWRCGEVGDAVPKNGGLADVRCRIAPRRTKPACPVPMREGSNRGRNPSSDRRSARTRRFQRDRDRSEHKATSPTKILAAMTQPFGSPVEPEV